MTIKEKNKLMTSKIARMGFDPTQVIRAAHAKARHIQEQMLGPHLHRGVNDIDAQRKMYETASLFINSEAWKSNADDGVAMRSWLENEAKNPDFVIDLCGDLTTRTSLWWAARWAQSAFPVINMYDARFAATLCTSTVPPELVDMVRAPFRAFLIRVPRDLISIDSTNGGLEDVRFIQAHEHFDEDGDRVWSLVICGSVSMIDRTCIPTREMCIATDPDEFDLPSLVEMTKIDKRALHMASRLVIGVCMSFDSDGGARPMSGDRKSLRKRGTMFPTKHEYIIGRPVKIDARGHVRNYVINGTKRGPQVTQTLVRGHWKNQPHGTGRIDRKFIHIEPYWRGPEDAPIVVRPHVIVDKDRVSPTK